MKLCILCHILVCSSSYTAHMQLIFLYCTVPWNSMRLDLRKERMRSAGAGMCKSSNLYKLQIANPTGKKLFPSDPPTGC